MKSEKVKGITGLKYSEKTRADYNKDIGRRIREARKGYGVTQKQMAEDLDIDPKYLSRIENGHSGCSIELIRSIGDYTQKPISYILGEDIKNPELSSEDQTILKKLSQCSSAQKEFISRIIDDLLKSGMK